MKRKSLAKSTAPPSSTSPQCDGLLVVVSDGQILSPAQLEFNKVMLRLEAARKSHERQRAKLDGWLAKAIKELMPLVETGQRLTFEMILEIVRSLDSFKFTKLRKEALKKMLSEKSYELLEDPCGFSEKEIEKIMEVYETHSGGHFVQDNQDDHKKSFERQQQILEAMVRDLGFDLDLSDLDPKDDRIETERKIIERIQNLMPNFGSQFSSKPRKPTKAQLEKQKRLAEVEEMKKRDLKSLYKQLVKVLHPDTETDPVRKLRMEDWMKRLTLAYSSNDLRELLRIEMEWLGMESSNLAQASEQKLEIYTLVLKEQISELKTKTQNLEYEPQYTPLNRFRDFFGYLENPTRIKSKIRDENQWAQGSLNLLKNGGPTARRVLNRWADEYIQEQEDMDLDF